MQVVQLKENVSIIWFFVKLYTIKHLNANYNVFSIAVLYARLTNRMYPIILYGLSGSRRLRIDSMFSYDQRKKKRLYVHFRMRIIKKDLISTQNLKKSIFSHTRSSYLKIFTHTYYSSFLTFWSKKKLIAPNLRVGRPTLLWERKWGHKLWTSENQQ